MKPNTFKTILRQWISLSIVVFVSYYLIWILIDIKSFLEDNDNLYFIALLDLFYCMLYTALCMWINSLITKIRFFINISFERLMTLSFILLFINLFIAYIFELIIDKYFWVSSDISVYWVSLYVFSISASILSVYSIVKHYGKVLDTQFKKNISLEKVILREQLNPHFLFNSLNTMNGLIDQDTFAAKKFVAKLARIYRYSLDHLHDDTICINDAITHTQNYIDLLNVRFPDSFIVTIDPCLYQCQDKILPLSLQLLIENAIKHNVLSKDAPLKIDIFIDGNFLVVKNSLTKNYVSTKPSHKIGLANLNTRYIIQCNTPIVVNRSDNYFEVKLPIIKDHEILNN